MPKKKRVPSPVARFKVSDKVRVKHGIRDTDYPDIPLGGWAGTISEVHNDGMYTIRWSKETLANIHPVVKQRSEKDGTVLEEYWLGDDDLEPDTGGPLNIEQPTEIVVKPLSPKDQDDRIRMVFGLTSNAPLPEVNDETLAAAAPGRLRGHQTPWRFRPLQGTCQARPDSAWRCRAHFSRKASVQGHYPRCRNQHALAGVGIVDPGIGAECDGPRP
jgi:uncharacterized protein YodC (DUF2158 family)